MTRRKRLTREAPHPRLEIVPMIDIMMFLLIFFVLIALRMIPDSGMALELPRAGTVAQLPPAPVMIVVDKDGEVHFNDRRLSLEALEAQLSGMDASERTNAVIAADRSISFQQIMTVMDVLRKNGISNIGLSATRP